MSSMVIEFEVDGETFMREINTEDVLPLAKVNDLKDRAGALWHASWPHPMSGGAVSDFQLDWHSDDSWLDLFDFAEYTASMYDA